MLPLVAALALAAAGPGLGNVAWTEAQLFTPIGVIQSPKGHGNVTMVQGYLFVITTSDSGGDPDSGAIELWDVSDLTAPALVNRVDDERTHALREPHGFSLARYGDRLYVAAQALDGIQIWDVTDPLALVRTAALDLPGIDPGDYSGDWWTFWAAPTLYVAGVDSGLIIVDATDPTAPVFASALPTGDLGGVSPAQAFVIGDLLVLTESQGPRIATMDVSDPLHPRLLRARDGKLGYSHLLAGDLRLYTFGSIPPRVSVHRIDDDGAITFEETFGLYFASGGYGTYQDGALHAGFSDQYVKLDLASSSEVGSGTSGREGRDEDFAVALGNVVFAGDDHAKGSALLPHQTAPDLQPPIVQRARPSDGATDIALTTSVGLSFSDLVDAASLTEATLWVETAGGARVPLIRSAQMGLVNAAPVEPLLPSTTYTIVADGVRDLVGNGSARFTASFTTGDGNDALLAPGDVVTALDTNSPLGAYALGVFGAGAVTYLDRDFVYQAGYPSRLTGAPYVQTRNNDKLSVSADFLQLDVAVPAEVVVLYDGGATSLPTWLASFTATGETVATDDHVYDAYSMHVGPGTVTLGGNNAADAANVDVMYTVVVVPDPLTCALTSVPALEGTVTLHAEGGAAGAVWDWQIGDGVLADAGAVPSLTLAPGRYGVVVHVTDGVREAVCSGVQIVHAPLLSAPARTTTPVIFVDGRVYVVNPDAGTVTCIDAATRAVVWEAPAGLHPTALAQVGGALWVVDRDGAQVVVLSTDGAASAAHALPRGSRPAAIVAADDGGAFITLSGTGEVARLDAAGGIAQRAFVVETATGLTLHGGALYVSRFVSSDAHGEVAVVDDTTLAVTTTIVLPIDLGPDTEASGRGLPNYLSALRVSPDGRRGFVSGKKDNVQRGAFRDGVPLTFESRVRAFVASIDLATNEEVIAERMDVNDREGTYAVAVSPLGDLLFVASQGVSVVDVFDRWTKRRVSQFHVGRAPQGLALADGTLAVQALLTRSASFFDVGALLSGAGNYATPLGDVVTVAVEPLSFEVLRGKQLFYDASDRRLSRDGYIACASCHLDGDHDGRTWDFTQGGEGLRNTIALRGSAPGGLHWTANFDEVQDFEHDLRAAFDGAGLLSDEDFAATSDPLGTTKAGLSADLDALAAYVHSLHDVSASPHRDDDGALTAAGRRGRAAFLSAGCAECHAGPAFADGVRHDVGTIGAGSGQGIGAPLAGVGFDTPGLRGVFATAPYLHDGSAATLDDAIARHADVDIADDERADVVAYLQQLDDAAGAPEDACAARDECVGGGDDDGGSSLVDGGARAGDPPPLSSGCGCGAARGSGDALLALLALVATALVRRHRSGAHRGASFPRGRRVGYATGRRRVGYAVRRRRIPCAARDAELP